MQHFARGRYALTQAYLQSGLGPNGSLMAPAYHCRTMLDPAIRLGAKIDLYPVRHDLSPDVEALKSCMRAATQPVKALLVPHYFGFAQNMVPLAEFCIEHGLVLIEDCSHAFAGPPLNAPSARGTIGGTGLYCVSSPYKFFPSADGGLLWSNSPEALLPYNQSRPGLIQEIKGLVRAIRQTLAWVPPPDAGTLAEEFSTLSSTDCPPGQTIEEDSADVSGQYLPSKESLQSLVISRWIFRHSDATTLVRKRRENYQAWIDGTIKLPHCKALFPNLPSDCTPYMFPFQIDCPEIHFHALKQLGIPIWRWDDMAVSSCRVAADFRLKLLHLPCHQGLSPGQMQWMIEGVQRVLSTMPMGKTP